MKSVVVVDYGVVNLKNILRGFEHIGASVKSSSDPSLLQAADRVVLPGVGAFASGMSELRSFGLDDAIRSLVENERPILGICLGMQMLLDRSSEHGDHEGLGVIPGEVLPIPNSQNGLIQRKIPHIGWNALNFAANREHWDDSCLDKPLPGDYYYFVHSYMAVPKNQDSVLATCDYEKATIIAAIKSGNTTGLQFHPERSGPSGLKILRQFLRV